MTETLAPSLPSLDQVEALVTSRRTSLLCDPDRPVPDELVDRLVELIRWAPNHKRTWPWRVAVVTGEGRARLGEAFAADLEASGRPADDPKVVKNRTKYLRAPLVVVVGAAPHDNELLDAENRYAVAAGIENLLLGARAAGLASFWASPPVCPRPRALAVCGFPADTELVGVVYLGWPTGEPPVPERPPIETNRVT